MLHSRLTDFSIILWLFFEDYSPCKRKKIIFRSILERNLMFLFPDLQKQIFLEKDSSKNG